MDTCGDVIQIRIYRTVILPVVLYGCETRFLTIREEHRLRWMFSIDLILPAALALGSSQPLTEMSTRIL
jgi:hypothetical protein